MDLFQNELNGPGKKTYVLLRKGRAKRIYHVTKDGGLLRPKEVRLV